MAKQVPLKAKTRAETGRAAVKRLRTQNLIPGIVYGAQAQPLTIAIGTKDFEKAIHHASSENVLVDLQVEEKGKSSSRLALIQEVQHHPVTDQVLHVDFHEVSATEKLRAAVTIRAVGEPAGVKTGGGVLEYVMREVHVECLPKDLPEVIEINVEKLAIGQGVHVGDIAPPAGVIFLDDKTQAMFIVAAPTAEEEVAAPVEGALAEPEVIGAKKEEGEEGAEGEAKPGAKGEAGKPAVAGKGEAKAAGKAEAKPAAGAAGKTEAKPAAGGKAEAKPAGGKPEAGKK